MSDSQGSIKPVARAADPIDPGVRIGHVHLRTADIDRIRAFYVDVLGFDVIDEARDVPGWGTTGDILFLSAGGYHHHLGLQHLEVQGRPAAARRRHRPAPHRARVSEPRALADAYRRLKSVDWPIRQTADHGTHEAIYITDPDGNDVELMWDRPVEQWPRDAEGHLVGQFGDELDLDELLRELGVDAGRSHTSPRL